ncbi:MAG: MBL fold metallo-hydrolase [Candidatus Scalindua sp.]|nr:MBL fold metallo-hydrolase [Candidatus Scalindua sp.]
MKISILTENCAGPHFRAEHGLSYLIEVEGLNLLFDTGHSDVFLNNAQQLNIDLEKEVETIVLSHGHWDHGDGLQHLEGKTLITHPASFTVRYRKSDHTYVGLGLTRKDIASRFNLITSEGPYFITPGVVFLGAIPRLNEFESQTTSFIDNQGQEDYVPDDSGLAIIHNNQLVIISGCAHSGICNMIDYAMEITGIRKIKAVLGGFHLKHLSTQTKRTIKYLKDYRISTLFPSHCTELPALLAFYDAFKINQLKSGMILHL